MNTATHLAQLVGESEYESSSTKYLTDLKEYISSDVHIRASRKLFSAASFHHSRAE